MPTDENNGVTPQNQQVDPNLTENQSVQNPGASDDFDFSFEDTDSNSNNGGVSSDLSGDMQDQMRRQGRSGMFLTPDEAITKSNEDNDMSLGNIDISSTVQPQKRSGMFLTPDEEGNKEEAMIEGKQYNFQGGNDTPADDSEDSYLAGIDPEDVEDSQDGSFDDGQQETPVQDSDYSQDKLDDEIEDLISFGDEPKANNDGAPIEQEPESQIEENIPVSEVAEEPVSIPDESIQPVDENTSEQAQDMQLNQVNSGDEQQNSGDDLQSQTDIKSINDGDGGNSEDWLSQEDKKVEESFGTQSENVSPDVDTSPETVSQNVENVINEPVETTEISDITSSNTNESVDSAILGDTALNENTQAENHDLHIENMGTDVVENGNGDLISDTGGMQQINQENTYVPNEAEFNQISSLLDSSSAGQIDLSNLNTEQKSAQQVESEQTIVDSAASPIFGTNINEIGNSVDSSVGQGEVFQSGLENNVDEELSQYEEVQPQTESVSQEVQSNVVENESNSEINLDSLLPEEAIVGQGTVQNNETNGSVISIVNEGATVEQSNQSVPQKKRKKQSGFKVLGIFGIVCFLLGVGIYVANKMFPEEFSKLFNKNDPVIGYLLGDDETNIDENNVDGENSDEDNIDENNIDGEIFDNVENSGDAVEQLDEQPDPDSLAGLLEGDDNGENLELSGDVENTEVNNGNENIEGSGDGNEAGNNTTGGDNSTGDFDPFAEFGDILEEAQETIEKLNGYVSSGQYYIEWGETNSKPTISTVGRKVVEMAQGELTKLENGGEIDTTAFDRMDELLKKLSDLAK